MTLRQRLLWTLVPSLLLLAVLGAAGMALLYHVSGLVGAVLRSNYDSVKAMIDLNEALERIDSSFNSAILNRQEAGREYADQWINYDRAMKTEEENITEKGEQELVDELKRLSRQYRQSGDGFFEGKHSRNDLERLYLEEKTGLRPQFNAIKVVVKDIRELNQASMERTGAQARQTATVSLVVFGIGLVIATGLAALFALKTMRAILNPTQALIRSAQLIGAGNLDQEVPVVTRDEIGALGEAFNRMTRQLRDYRRTHLSRLLRAQRTSQATIDSFPDPVLVVDPEGRVEMANPAARQLFGLSPPPMMDNRPGLGESAQAPVWQPPAALIEPLREALQGQRAFLTQAFGQTVGFRLPGEERAYLPQILPIRDPYGNTLGAAVVLNDVTRFRLLDQIKSDLVATVSHELKTPLASVRLAVHLLLEETVGPLTAKQTELLVDARDNAERLVNMIEHLLALARLEEGHERLEVRPEAPADLLRVAADLARPRAESAQIHLGVEVPEDLPPIAADARRLGHALNNLLDNALTYTPAGGRITLRAAAVGPDRVRLTVADTGPGIPPEHLAHVFERFFRVPGRTHGQGTGLGLAIVREILTAHGGTARCESEPGKGTTFDLEVPVWTGSAGTAPAPVPAATAERPEEDRRTR
jgi:signal transduction histidine kinase/HAMP domain-containing protein